MSTYNEKLTAISRTKINLVELVMDYCSLSFGVAPCTASGTKCFNTFITCGDTANYDLTTKTYQFINANMPLNLLNNFYGYKPYIKNVDLISGEIKDGETIIKRLKVQFYDELGDDFGIDPYLTDRASVQGTFWKKFIARNKNYKGRLIKLYEGFDDVASGSFELKFVGKIDNIEINKGIVTIEAVDLLRSLKDIKYPVAYGIYLSEVLGDIFTCGSESEMLALDAQLFDYAERTDFEAPSATCVSAYQSGGTLSEGITYYYVLVQYDVHGRPIGAINLQTEITVAADPAHNSAFISWSNITGTSYSRVFRIYDSDTIYYWQTTGTSLYDTGAAGTDGVPPGSAKRYFQLNGVDATDIDNWDALTSIDVDVNDASDLPSSGYIIINKEVMYYASKSGNTLQNLLRGLFETEYERHEIYDGVFRLLSYAADNPFTILDDMLTTVAGIDAAYIDAKFATYESAWTGIDVSLRPLVKASNLAEIYFDLVSLVNCLSWVGEDGKIKIIKHTESPASYNTLTDEANIIFNSASVDLNEDSRFTRWGLYWNKTDATKGIKESGAYNRFDILVDADAESEAGYNESREDIQYSIWLNDDSDTASNISTHITALLADRQTRTKQTQEIINASVELKDNTNLLGDIIKLSTTQLQDIDGNDYSEVAFRIMKKEPDNNRIKLKLQRRYS